MHHLSVFVLEYIVIVIQHIFSNHNIHQVNFESVILIEIQEIFYFSDTFNTLTISRDKSCNEIELYCAASMVLG